MTEGERIAQLCMYGDYNRDYIAGLIDDAIAASHKPVSLEKCRQEAWNAGLDFINYHETPEQRWLRVAKAVLDSVGVNYVE